MPKFKDVDQQNHHHLEDDGGDGHIVRGGPDMMAPEIGQIEYRTVDGAARADYSLDPYAGGTFRNKEIADLDRVVDQIDSGASQDVSDGVITFAFFDHPTSLGLNNNPSFGEGKGYTPFNEAQRAEARESVELWDDLIAADIVEVEPGPGASSWGKNEADIWLANTSTGPAQAWAYFPGYGNQYTRVAGDVWTADPEYNWTNNWLDYGGYGATTLVHELGHSLGLSHPGQYNGSGATTYVDQAEYAQDSEQYTIMSYWDESETSNQPFLYGIVDWSTGFYNNPQTPLVHDILTIQAKYGADPTTRVGDTVYGWNSTAGNEVYDFSVNLFPYLSIYDAGGNDTIDMSGANASVFINLEPGSFSSGASEVPDESVINQRLAELDEVYTTANIGPVSDGTQERWMDLTTSAHAPYIAYEYGYEGVGVTSHDNLSIAYGTIIENAIGSTMRDVLWGNEVSNKLEGLGGDDVLNGRAGADMLIGGEGADTFEFSDMDAIDTIADFESGVDAIDVSQLGFTSFSDSGAFSGTAGELIYANGMIMGDVDGDGEADFAIDVQGDPVTADDLLL